MHDLVDISGVATASGPSAGGTDATGMRRTDATGMRSTGATGMRSTGATVLRSAGATVLRSARATQGRDPSPLSPLVVTSDAQLRDEALTAVAAAGVEAMVASDVAAALPSWLTASMVLVGIDQAATLGDRPRRTLPPVHVLGDRYDHEELCTLSARFGASVAVLPEQRGFLTETIRARCVPSQQGSLVVVQGAGGGLGVSTTAAGLAWRAHTGPIGALLVDLDPYGGGLDLALGVETEPGWRWPQLAEVTGGISGLAGRLPTCEGLPVLSAGRERPGRSPSPTAVSDVLTSARADHGLVVVDLGRGLDPAAAAAARGQASLVLLVVRDDIRGVAAAAGLLADDPGGWWQLILRRHHRGEGLPVDAVTDALGRPVVAVAPYDRSLPTAALRGAPPGPGSGRRWRRHLDRLLALDGAGLVGGDRGTVATPVQSGWSS